MHVLIKNHEKLAEVVGVNWSKAGAGLGSDGRARNVTILGAILSAMVVGVLTLAGCSSTLSGTPSPTSADTPSRAAEETQPESPSAEIDAVAGQAASGGTSAIPGTVAVKLDPAVLTGKLDNGRTGRYCGWW